MGFTTSRTHSSFRCRSGLLFFMSISSRPVYRGIGEEFQFLVTGAVIVCILVYLMGGSIIHQDPESFVSIIILSSLVIRGVGSWLLEAGTLSSSIHTYIPACIYGTQFRSQSVVLENLLRIRGL